MSIDTLNNYGITGMNGTNSTSSSAGTDKLTMDDFLQLLVAQMQNQDMYNTMDDSEYMTQMAQFSMLEAVNDMSELSMTSYGVSLIGKEVNVGKISDNGTLSSIEGIVESVNFYNGGTQIVVDGQSYPMSSIMSVNEPKIIIPNAEIK